MENIALLKVNVNACSAVASIAQVLLKSTDNLGGGRETKQKFVLPS